MLATGVIGACIVGARKEGLSGWLQAKHTMACIPLAAPHSSQKSETGEVIITLGCGHPSAFRRREETPAPFLASGSRRRAPGAFSTVTV